MALPTPLEPTTAPASGHWLDLVKGYLHDGALVLGLIISVTAFLMVAYAALAKFNAARQAKAEWGGHRSIALGHFSNIRQPKKGATEWAELGLLVVAGAGLLLVIGFLVNAVTTIF